MTPLVESDVAPSTRFAPRGVAVGLPCRGCDTRLPIRLAGEGETPALWECTLCAARFPGVMVEDAAPRILSRVQLAPVHFDVSDAEPVPDLLRRLVQKLAEEPPSAAAVERRKSVRVPQQLEVAIAPLDENYTPLRSAFRAIVHNLSQTGVGFIATFPIDAPNVAILLEPSRDKIVQVFGRVVRTRELAGKFFEVGVQFRLRLNGRIA